jgi:hypothetical protein
MHTKQADAIASAIAHAARRRDHASLTITTEDADELGNLLGALTEGMTHASALAEALVIGMEAGGRLANNARWFQDVQALRDDAALFVFPGDHDRVFPTD